MKYTLCCLVARRVVEMRQEIKGKIVTVTFLPEQSSPEMKEPGRKVTRPEIKDLGRFYDLLSALKC